MFDVVISAIAEQEARSAYDWWATNRSRQQANDWYDGLIDHILSLEEMPERFPLADENDNFPLEIRQLNFGIGRRPTHRVVFTIHADRVVILRVRHVAQESISPYAE